MSEEKNQHFKEIENFIHDYAKKNGYKSWGDLLSHNDNTFYIIRGMMDAYAKHKTADESFSDEAVITQISTENEGFKQEIKRLNNLLNVQQNKDNKDIKEQFIEFCLERNGAAYKDYIGSQFEADVAGFIADKLRRVEELEKGILYIENHFRNQALTKYVAQLLKKNE